MSNISKALLAAQRLMGNATKDAKNPFFKSKYANLNAIREAVIPQLNAAGVVVLQPTVMVEGRQFVRTTLMHESGETFISDTEIVCAKQNDPQAYGSAISYARRYGLQAIVCIGSEDDDGEKSMGRGLEQETKLVPVKTTAEEVKVAVAAIVESKVQTIVGTTQKLGVGNTPVPKKFEVKRPTVSVVSVEKGDSNGI